MRLTNDAKDSNSLTLLFVRLRINQRSDLFQIV